jgi:RNA polymerase sigma-70 factor (ECF subfamily)
MSAAASEVVPATLELEQLYREHHALVLKSAYRVTGSMTDAEDVLQTVFLRLATRPLDANAVANVQGYLHRAAVNAALDIVRSRHDARSQPIDETFDVRSTAAWGSPERAQNSAEIRSWLRKALGRMNPRAAEAFVLRYIEELDNKKIARLLNTSESAIGVLLHRTREQLRKDYRQTMRGEKQ